MEDNYLTDKLETVEPRYQNKGEEEIGQILDSYGLPFLYKQPTIIYNEGENEIWEPSFTLPQYGCGVVDYINSPEQSQLEDRIEVYRYNQIPATVLGPKDLDKRNFESELYDRIVRDIVKPMKSFGYSDYRNDD